MKNKINYFLARSSMFGIGSFLIFRNCGADAWLPIILGTLLGIIIIYIYSKLKELLRGKTLKDALKNTLIGKIYLFIFILFYLYLMTIILSLIPLFVNSFYLLDTPKIIINIPFLLITLYITFKGKFVLENLSNLLCVFSIAIIIFFAFLLTKYFNIEELFPILTTNTKNIILTSLIYAAITSIPLILTIDYHNDLKDNIKNYLLAASSIILIGLCTTLALGRNLIRVYSFPEYAVLKQIKYLNFIENIENISSFIWYFDLFITLSTTTTNLKNILPKKYNSLTFIIISLIILIISSYLIGGNYIYILHLFYNYSLVLFIFFIIFITLIIYLKIKNKNTN